jgi:hypothetical protein
VRASISLTAFNKFDFPSGQFRAETGDAAGRMDRNRSVICPATGKSLKLRQFSQWHCQITLQDFVGSLEPSRPG